MVEHEQKNFRNKEKVAANETTGISSSDMGDREDQAKGAHSSTAKTVETPEAQRKIKVNRKRR